MPPLVVPGIARYAIEQKMSERVIINIMDILVSPAAGSSRDLAVPEVGRRLLQAWTDNVRPLQTNSMLNESVSFVDLNSLNGVVGSVTTGTGTAVWPLLGAKGVQALPTNSVAFIVKNTVAARGSKAGRLFLSGLPETDSSDNPNVLTPAATTALTNAFTALRTAINTYASAQVVSAVVAVVHTSALTPGQGTFTTVGSFSAESGLSTQSRRIRRR